jgi:heme/copper-type cytochrome/quinol oxidase subunit 1
LYIWQSQGFLYKLPLAGIKFSHTLQMNQKPYNLLLLTGLIFVLASFFLLNQNNSVDVHIHDTYFVIAHAHIFWFLAILSLLVWTLYFLTNKFLFSKTLTWAHIIITILTLILFVFTLYFGDSLSNLKPRRYYDHSSLNSFGAADKYTKAIGRTLSILIFGQIIFIINFIAGLFKRRH